jgi:hypothetical protein
MNPTQSRQLIVHGPRGDTMLDIVLPDRPAGQTAQQREHEERELEEILAILAAAGEL